MRLLDRHYNLILIYYAIRNKLFPIYTGPASVCYIGYEEEIPKVLRTKGDKRKTVRVAYTHPYYKLTLGNTYQAERQDRISYYLRDDRGELCEASKNIQGCITYKK